MSSVMEAEPKQKPEPYVMPKVEVGDSVVWFSAADPKTPHSGEVVTTGQHTVTILLRGARQFRESVRHVSDPYLKEHPQYRSEHGSFDFSRQQKLLMKLTEDVEQLRSEKGDDGSLHDLRTDITTLKRKVTMVENKLKGKQEEESDA